MGNNSYNNLTHEQGGQIKNEYGQKNKRMQKKG
jgi:hypothetical protein